MSSVGNREGSASVIVWRPRENGVGDCCCAGLCVAARPEDGCQQAPSRRNRSLRTMSIGLGACMDVNLLGPADWRVEVLLGTRCASAGCMKMFLACVWRQRRRPFLVHRRSRSAETTFTRIALMVGSPRVGAAENHSSQLTHSGSIDAEGQLKMVEVPERAEQEQARVSFPGFSGPFSSTLVRAVPCPLNADGRRMLR